MTQVAITFDENGFVNFNSNNNTSYFFNNLNTFSSLPQTIPSNSFSQIGSFANPRDLPGFDWVSNTEMKIVTVGCIDVAGLNYYPPTMLNTSDQSQTTIFDIGTVLESECLSIGVPPEPQENFGITAFNENNFLNISEDYQQYVVHPDENGNYLRSATAVTLSPNDCNTCYINNNDQRFYTDENLFNFQNITFDKPYASPPLIFVVSSAGPIAFNGVIQNSSGQFVGASVVAAASYQNNGGSFSFGGWGENAYSFDYFIVSNESSPNITSSGYGMRVFDSAGNITFDSSYRTADFSAISVPIVGVSSSSGQIFNQSLSGSKPSGTGLLINNFPSFSGHFHYITAIINSASSVYSMTMCGRYLDVSDSSFQILSAPTTASRFFSFTQEFGAKSYDYHKGNISQQSLIVSNYQFGQII